MRRLLILIKNIIAIPYRFLFTEISIFSVLQESKVDRNAAICKGCRFYRSEIGKYSYVGNNTFINNTKIGNFSSISGDCCIGNPSHPTDWVSTSPVFHRWENILHRNFSRHEYSIFQDTYIGSDVWIGQGVFIKAGVKIHNGAVVGMGSIVTKDVPPYEIWAGNPARKINDRFDDKIKNSLIKSKWWEWDDSKIASQAHLFNKPELFLNSINDEIEQS